MNKENLINETISTKDAISLINEAVSLGILDMKDNCIYVYKNEDAIFGEGWYWEAISLAAKDLSENPKGIKLLRDKVSEFKNKED